MTQQAREAGSYCHLLLFLCLLYQNILEGLGMLHVNHIFNYHPFIIKRKLPGTPLLLVVPSGPTTSITSGTSSKRARFWHNHLSVLGKVVPVTMHTSNGGSGVSISQCLDHIIGAVRIKVLEVKKLY